MVLAEFRVEKGAVELVVMHIGCKVLHNLHISQFAQFAHCIICTVYDLHNLLIA